MTAATPKSVLDHLRTGDFLDRARVRRIAVIVLAASVITIAGLIATSHDGIDIRGRPLGSDFFSFWSAANAARAEGRADAAYDISRNRQFQSDHLDGESAYDVPFWGVPPFLLLIAPFAALPFAPAWILFSGLTFVAYFAAMRKLAPPGSPSALLIVAAPGVLANAAIGQAGLLFAGLFAAAACLYRSSSLAAGLFFGLIALKPQYAVLVPLCLVAAGRWRQVAAGTATVFGLAAAATAAFGASVWRAFAANNVVANYVLLESGAVRWEKNVSIYAALRRYGVVPEIAWSAQIAVAVAVAIGLFVLWRSATDVRLKLAALIVGALLAPPYVLDYDLVILAPAIALIVSRALETGFLDFEKIVLAAAWTAPATLPLSVAFKLPIGLIAVAACFAMILARAFHEKSSAKPASGASP